MNTAPANSIVLTSSDEDTIPLWYYHYGLKQRSDIQLVTLGLLQFDWYRASLIQNAPEIKLIPIGENQFDPV